MAMKRFARAGALFLIAAAVCLMIAGAWRGETDTLRKKSIRVCLECIGIG